MKKIYLLLLILNVVLMNGCKEQAPKQSSKQQVHQERTVKSEVDLIKKYDHEIRDYYREIYDIGLDGIIAMSNKDQVKYTDIAVELMCHALYRYGFKSVDNITAANAIKKYYGVDINRTASLSENGFHKFVFPGGDVKGRARQSKILSDGYTFFNNTIFIPKDNLLLYAPVIDNVVELKGYLYEDEVPDSVFKKGRITYSLEKSIFYVNQFIFHDSKAALTWLMNNDRNFLRDLFLKYGYDKSDVINKMMLDEIKVVNRIPEADETKALFASRCANGKLLIHRGLMEYMLKHVNEENEYFLMLDQYASTLLDLRNYPEFDGLTKEERYRIGAYVGYYYGLLFNKGIGTSIDINGFGHGLCYDEDLRDYLKRNKYFHLPGFEDIAGKHYRRYRMDVDIEMEKMRDE